ncbi:DUF4260 domain-containing protein [Maribacter polysaccharolyticus]|uniref:DUF4260 domain-containing protein n=1 Tax=Maribacter polysaccharolyticus TaxID=3020831 RepID=UPI00237F5CD7|nr:DUF4260 domain-containing protein [Maribacter polysaccharolyticus]MDE3742639.1 DUF4260 domain-containing protein [Maribacter polysaccharolyticus]
MKILIKLEEFMMFTLGLFMFGLLGYQWWWFLVLIMVPDIGMVGYLFGNKAGAIAYNVFHHKGLTIVLYFAGMFFSSPIIQLAGVILFSHAALDRVLGYGLKYNKGFKYTHLGEIGKKNG